MPPTTSTHALRYPVATDPDAVPADMLRLAVDVDVLLPRVSTATPVARSGLVWFNPTTGLTQISDGSTWIPLTGLTSLAGSGGAVAGTFDVTKPRRHHYVRGQVTSDAQGLWTVATPAGCTAVLFATPVVELGNAGAVLCAIVVRADLGGPGGVVLQSRAYGTGAALPSVSVQFGLEIVWQA